MCNILFYYSCSTTFSLLKLVTSVKEKELCQQVISEWVYQPCSIACYLNVISLCRANAQQPKLFVGMILILIFAEALALYGLIVGIILSSRAGQSRADWEQRCSYKFFSIVNGDILSLINEKRSCLFVLLECIILHSLLKLCWNIKLRFSMWWC